MEIIMSRKVVVVTGASRGIGKAIALKYAKKGYDTAICCRSREKELLAVRREIEAFSVRCITFWTSLLIMQVFRISAYCRICTQKNGIIFFLPT